MFSDVQILNVYYKIWYKNTRSIKQNTVFSGTSFLLVFLFLLWLNNSRDSFWNLNIKCIKAFIFKTFFFSQIVLYVNFVLKAFYLTYMAIFSHHEFRLRTPEFLQSFDKCDNLCYKYIKDIHIFEYWHSFFLIFSKVWVVFVSLLLLWNIFYV